MPQDQIFAQPITPSFKLRSTKPDIFISTFFMLLSPSVFLKSVHKTAGREGVRIGYGLTHVANISMGSTFLYVGLNLTRNRLKVVLKSQSFRLINVFDDPRITSIKLEC